jgi:2-keto-4-pentenoate hydratase
VQTESPQQESWQQESVATVSTVVSAAGVVLPPQDAKDTAAKAANMKTNFFIFLVKF